MPYDTPRFIHGGFHFEAAHILMFSSFGAVGNDRAGRGRR
jgi:hypothetical protein